MSLQLIQSPASPFARKVRVVILEAGLADRVDLVPVATTPLAQDATLARTNPLAKIPALVRDDGPTIYDSRVINRYLDDVAAADLYPAGRIWEVLTLEAMADGVMEAAVLITYERGSARRPRAAKAGCRGSASEFCARSTRWATAG